ncbi:hypothetical protein ACFVU3_14225 [Streptomyces sp. NPDC058052]|uniref:hypothetical protein n=1 Tax=Streptomyces sp. NPDC058052 TaxID=3346316 RepID=UPI0036E51A0D
MDDAAAFESALFRDGEPYDVAFDSLWVTYGEFWLVSTAGCSVDVSTAIPTADSIVTNGGAVGIPAKSSAGHMAMALSLWSATPPDGRGIPLGSSSITVEGRELSLVNVEGREPAPALVVEEDGTYQVRVWRSELGRGTPRSSSTSVYGRTPPPTETGHPSAPSTTSEA